MWSGSRRHFLSPQIILPLRLVFINFSHSYTSIIAEQSPPCQQYLAERKEPQSKMQSWWWFSRRNGQCFLAARFKTLLAQKYFLIASATSFEISYVRITNGSNYKVWGLAFWQVTTAPCFISSLSHQNCSLKDESYKWSASSWWCEVQCWHKAGRGRVGVQPIIGTQVWGNTTPDGHLVLAIRNSQTEICKPNLLKARERKMLVFLPFFLAFHLFSLSSPTPWQNFYL